MVHPAIRRLPDPRGLTKTAHSKQNSQISINKQFAYCGPKPNRGFSPPSNPYGLFALEGLAFWDTSRPSNCHLFRLTSYLCGPPSIKKAPRRRNSVSRSHRTTVQLSYCNIAGCVLQILIAFQQTAAIKPPRASSESTRVDREAQR